MHQQPPLGSAEGSAGRFSLGLAGIWLLFLLQPLLTNWGRRHDPEVAIAFAAMAIFAVVYLLAFEMLRRRRDRLLGDFPARRAWAFVLVLVFLTVVMCWGIDQDGVGSSVYVAVTAAMLLPSVAATWFALSLAAAIIVLTSTVPGWEPDYLTPAIVISAAFVMWGVRQIITRNMHLVAMKESSDLLLVDRERTRFARDLHDILGHSLTVITVKAELANRLLDVDLDRARKEIADLERLARDALEDVRRTARGFREITLPGEIAHAREALTTAGIMAVLPTSTEEVPGPLREVFAFAIREAVTNVIRHSYATACRVELAGDRVRVIDNGKGGTAVETEGSGLNGLRERAATVGATVRTEAVQPRGFMVEVSGPQ